MKIPAGALVVATLVATLLTGGSAWGHTFPAVRTVVVQVERCELAVLVGWRPATGDATETLIARGNASKSLRDLMTTTALAPLQVSVDGKPLVPTSVRAKVGLEPGGARPMIVVLVTYTLPGGNRLMIRSNEPKTTSISWTDRDSHRVALVESPTQGKWYAGVASMLLSLSATTCGPSPRSSSSPAAPSP